MKLNLLLLSAAAMVNAATATATAPVDLKTAGDYVMLAKSGISTVPTSSITGDIGVSPIAATAITGFSLVLDSAGQHSTSSQVTGEVHAASYGLGVAAKLTQAVLDMQAAYTDAASRTTTDSGRRELAGGLIGGLTLTPGVYTFTTAVPIYEDLYLDALGDPDAVFVIQTTGVLTLAANKNIVLLNGAKAMNVFWQVAGNCATGASSVMQGNLLIFTNVAIGAGATVIGGIYSQTAVNLQMATITRAGVECWAASDCGDTTLFNCESDQCVSLSCDTEQTGVECCEDAECDDIVSFHCESNSCVLRDCDRSLQGVECCSNDDCSSRGSGSIACVSNVCINRGEPRFTLTWFGDDDLDLHVLTPGGDHIYYANTFDSVSNGRLDHDDLPPPQVMGLYVESVYFPLDGTAPVGSYTYYVRNWRQRGVAPDAWKFEVYVGDNLIAQSFGTTTDHTNSDQYMFNYDGPMI